MTDSMPRFPEPDVLDRYLAGEGSTSDAEIVRAWAAMSPENAALLASLATVAVWPERKEREPDVGKWLSTFQDTVLTPHGAGQNGTSLSQDVRRVACPSLGNAHVNGGWRGTQTARPWYLIAAAVLGFLAILAGWHFHTSRFASHQTTSVLAYATANGERANITLPDGSTVALNVASRLEIPADYTKGNHTLHLNGEAMFVVSHHDGAPFTVVAGRTATRVLGTSFAVRHYATDTSTMIAVRSGKVSVDAPGVTSLVLNSARRVEIEGNGAQVGRADSTQFSFVSGVLTLTGEPFAQAIPELDRWYGADIRLGDSALAKRRLVGECAAGSLEELTSLLEGTFNVRVVRDGRVITLFSR